MELQSWTNSEKVLNMFSMVRTAFKPLYSLICERSGAGAESQVGPKKSSGCSVGVGAISNQGDPKVSSVVIPFKTALIVGTAAMASFLSKSLVSSVSNN